MYRCARLIVLCCAVAALSGRGRAEDPPSEKPPPTPVPRWIAPRSGEVRAKALQRYGGNAATEAAVKAGLDWLARHQDADGGWDADGFQSHCAKGDGGKPLAPCEGIGKGQHGEDEPCPFDAAISACATLAFLGDGHLPQDETNEKPSADGPSAQGTDRYAATVTKALARLRRGGDVWSLPLATEAFAEAEALERKGRWRADVDRGVEQLLRARGEDGAWGYASGFRPGSDVPYSAFVISALVAARDLGVTLPADLAPRVNEWLGTLEEKNGKLAYLLDGRAYGYTPTTANAHCAFAMRELLEVGTNAVRHRAHVACVVGDLPAWTISYRTVDVPGRGKVAVQVGNLSMYQWWFGTVGAFQRGGATWTSWFAALKPALARGQQKDGCARGSWDPIGTYERQTGGRVFATALGVLMLEEPYRHMRLADPAPK